MVNILYPGVGLVCIIILSFLGFQNESYSNIGRKQLYFRSLILNVLIYCLVDVIWGCLASGVLFEGRYVDGVAIGDFIVASFLAPSWIRYVICCTSNIQKVKKLNISSFLLLFPIFVLSILFCVHYHSESLYIQVDGSFVRDNSYIVKLLFIFQFLYFFSSFIISIYAIIKKTTITRISHGILFFSIIPAISCVLQYLNSSIPFFSIGYMLACFIAFVYDVIVEREFAAGKTLELRQKQILDKCNVILADQISPDKGIDTLLSLLCNYYDADRVFIMEIDTVNPEFVDCTYEYCIQKDFEQINSLKHISYNSLKIWFERLDKQDDFYLSNIFDFVYKNDFVISKLKQNNIVSSMTSSLRSGGKLFGFIGFDNPRDNLDDFSIVRSVSIYINSELLRKKQLENEKKTSGAVLLALAAEYSSVYYIDLEKNGLRPYRYDSLLKKLYGKYYEDNITYKAAYEMYVNDLIVDEDKADMKPYGDCDYLIKKLKNRSTIKRQFRSVRNGHEEYFQAKWVRIGDEDNIQAAVLGFANIDEQVRSKELLFEQKKELEKQQMELDSAIEKAEDAERISQIDRLTGLYNKISGQNEILSYLFNKSDSELYSLIFIDIDKFKDFNDKYGHLVGDDILEIVGSTIKKNCRKNDVAVRFGGDEFVILLKNVQDSIPAVRKANSIQNELNKITSNKEYLLTCSIGIVITSTSELDEAIQKADDALYEVKENGRNNIRVVETK